MQSSILLRSLAEHSRALRISPKVGGQAMAFASGSLANGAEKWRKIAADKGLHMERIEEERMKNLSLVSGNVGLQSLFAAAEEYRRLAANEKSAAAEAAKDSGYCSGRALEGERCEGGHGVSLTAALVGELSDVPPGQEWKLMCRVCDKPNSLHVSSCSSCGFPMEKPADAQLVVTNPFIPIIEGTAEDHEVLRREEECLLFKDKFPVAEVHLQCIPTMLGIEDATFLCPPLLSPDEAISLCERMKAVSMEVLREEASKVLDLRKLVHPLEHYAVMGFNIPVSVRHLHLHVAFPPLHSVDTTFQYPRFHPFEKVVADIKQHGRVISYFEQPCPQEGASLYARLVAANAEVNVLMQNR